MKDETTTIVSFRLAASFLDFGDLGECFETLKLEIILNTEWRGSQLTLEAANQLKFTDTVLIFIDFFKCSDCVSFTPTHCLSLARALVYTGSQSCLLSSVVIESVFGE
jgi:hypothetical protein